MASSDAAEIRAIFGKDAFRLVARSRLPLPRPEKTYECATYTSPVFSFADFGGAAVLILSL